MTISKNFKAGFLQHLTDRVIICEVEDNSEEIAFHLPIEDCNGRLSVYVRKVSKGYRISSDCNFRTEYEDYLKEGGDIDLCENGEAVIYAKTQEEAFKAMLKMITLQIQYQ